MGQDQELLFFQSFDDILRDFIRSKGSLQEKLPCALGFREHAGLSLRPEATGFDALAGMDDRKPFRKGYKGVLADRVRRRPEGGEQSPRPNPSEAGIRRRARSWTAQRFGRHTHGP